MKAPTRRNHAWNMGRSQNYEPVLVIDYITASKISGYENWTPILGTTHSLREAPCLLGWDGCLSFASIKLLGAILNLRPYSYNPRRSVYITIANRLPGLRFRLCA